MTEMKAAEYRRLELKKMSEAQHQIRVVQWAWSQDEPLSLLYAIPNEVNVRSDDVRVAISKAKKRGLRPGTPDLCLPVSRRIILHTPGGRCMRTAHALYIEMKKPGGKTTKLQRERQAALIRQGNVAVVCYDYEEAQSVLARYISGALRFEDGLAGFPL